MASPWLAIDEKEMTSEVRIPARELIVGGRYYLALGKYKQALTVLCNSYPRVPQERFLFGELILTIQLAVVRLKTGDTAEAVMDFERAYDLSFSGEFEMPFVDLGRLFHPLATAASNHEGCVIPREWLKMIARKASAYAKKTAVITNLFKREIKAKDDIQLSDREREALHDLYHGLSREEMAVSRHLSINTINKILQSVFIKLNANNSVDAIRIAIEENLIE